MLLVSTLTALPSCDSGDPAELTVRNDTGAVVTGLWLDGREGSESTGNLVEAPIQVDEELVINDLEPGDFAWRITFQPADTVYASPEILVLYPGRNNLRLALP